MKDRTIKKIAKQINKIAKNSAKIYYNKKYVELTDQHRFQDDDVTNLDIKTQAYIKSQCLKLIKNANFIGEEGNAVSLSPYTFIVDPIDGTFNFKHNLNNYGTQIVLLKNNEPIISSLYLPSTKSSYTANKFGAFENKKHIKTSDVTQLKEAVVAVGDFTHADGTFEKQIEIIGTLAKNFKRIRMLGSSCVDNCMLASGKIDAYIIYSSNKWDLLPGQFLAKKAGCIILCNKEKNIFVSGNPDIANKIAELINL